MLGLLQRRVRTGLMSGTFCPPESKRNEKNDDDENDVTPIHRIELLAINRSEKVI